MNDLPGRAPFSRIGIVGLGLMGGSIARSLRALPDPPLVRATSEDPTDLRAALDAGAIDVADTPEAGFFRDLELLIYCTPLNATLALLPVHGHFMDPGTLVTDVVSLKTPVLEAVKGAGLEGSFVGSHPMCGGEGSGFGASRRGLFSGARIWIVPDTASPAQIERIEGFWASLGGETVRIGAHHHDRLMAVASHLPQLTSNVLASVMARFDCRQEDLGPGGKDMTRLAGSSPDMWEDLFRHAPDDLLRAVEAMAEALREIGDHLDSGRGERIGQLMRQTRAWVEGRKWS